MIDGPRRLMFVGSPFVRSVAECDFAGVKISQISNYDVTREFILKGYNDSDEKLTKYKEAGDSSRATLMMSKNE